LAHALELSVRNGDKNHSCCRHAHP